jgi:hypothetical protein
MTPMRYWLSLRVKARSPSFRRKRIAWRSEITIARFIKERNRIERFIGKIKQFRRIFSRFDK